MRATAVPAGTAVARKNRIRHITTVSATRFSGGGAPRCTGMLQRRAW